MVLPWRQIFAWRLRHGAASWHNIAKWMMHYCPVSDVYYDIYYDVEGTVHGSVARPHESNVSGNARLFLGPIVVHGFIIVF